jgi:hypothetical protein
MPIKDKSRYPKNWPEISQFVRFERAGGKCEFCGAQHRRPNPRTGRMVSLAAAHLDHNPEHTVLDKLRALCNCCHLNYDRQHNLQLRVQRVVQAMRRAGQLYFLF